MMVAGYKRGRTSAVQLPFTHPGQFLLLYAYWPTGRLLLSCIFKNSITALLYVLAGEISIVPRYGEANDLQKRTDCMTLSR
jgi:hypothetical protein